MRDYNEQVHWAHRDRPDERHSPQRVLDWVIGRPHEPVELAGVFHPVRYGRRLDRLGYVGFRHWRIYGERGLAKAAALVWLSEERLTVAYGEEPLAYYIVQVGQRGQLTAVTEPRLVATAHESPQPFLWKPTTEEWLLALPVQRRAPRRRRQQSGIQGALALTDVSCL